MTPSEAAKLLAKLAATDGRTISEASARAWAETLPDVGLAEALAAVPLHFRETSDWCMPVHILRIVETARHERHRVEREAAELEAAKAQALEAAHTEDRSAAVVDLVARIREQLPESDPRKLRPREHYWRQQQRGNAPAEPNPLYRVPPPGGYPVPGDDEPQGLAGAIVETFAAGWPDDERRTS